ncbi:hypothetical protein BC941DRAFT_420145 [Chlamydoabsidia padenii]|nr:hypothetical protein BC941DRAFT_420145 [Chlamydoabsidia padenii]
MPTISKVVAATTLLFGFISSCYSQSSGDNSPLPCNGFPEHKDLPVNYFFWISAHNAGLDSNAYKCPHTSQERTVTQMLQDGIRHLDINVCTRNGKTSLCTPFEGKPTSNVDFAGYLKEIMDYVRQEFHQVVVLNINSIVNDDTEVATFKDMETIIDTVCKQQTDITLGTDEYEQYECPFIYVQPEYTMDWPTLGELVNYDPETAMWEGDGDHVGVQSQLILTHGDSIRRTGGDMSHYFSKVYARHSNENGKDLNHLGLKLQTMCQSNGPISLQVYSDHQNCNTKQGDKIIDPDFIEDMILSKEGCDLNSVSTNTFFNLIQLDQYHHYLPYLKDLQSRMNQYNHAKLEKRIEQVPRSTEITGNEKKQRPLRDEL